MAPPRVLIRNLLIRLGYHLSRVPDQEELQSLVRSLRPVSIQQELIRLGGSGDGGYLIPNDLKDIEACFSPGVGNVARFEEELISFDVRSFMADPSVKSAPVNHELFSFEKKFIGVMNRDNMLRLEDWVQKHFGAESNDLILQMDIEGAEYPVLLDTPSDLLRRFRIMVIEFHALDMLFSNLSFEILKQTFEKLLRDFTVVHIHPNNRADVLLSNGIEIPLTMEFTFFRNDRVKHSQKELNFPHALDSPNHPEKADVVLPRCWW